MDVLPGVQPRGLFRGHLQEHPVPVWNPWHALPDAWSGPSCTRTCTSRAVVLKQSNPHVAPLAVNVVYKVAGPRDLAGEDARLRVVVLSAVIEQFVELHGAPTGGKAPSAQR